MKNRPAGDGQTLEILEERPPGSDRHTRLFEELALPALDDLYAFACRLERDPAAAADLLHDALLTGFRKFFQLNSTPSFQSWMAAIVRRTFLNRHRRKGRSVPLSEAALEAPLAPATSYGRPGPDERLIARRLGRELKQALDELPEPQRLAVFLIDVQGYSYGEASEVLSIRPGTVASRVARGRARLRERLLHLARERGWTR